MGRGGGGQGGRERGGYTMFNYSSLNERERVNLSIMLILEATDSFSTLNVGVQKVIKMLKKNYIFEERGRGWREGLVLGFTRRTDQIRSDQSPEKRLSLKSDQIRSVTIKTSPSKITLDQIRLDYTISYHIRSTYIRSDQISHCTRSPGQIISHYTRSDQIRHHRRSPG